MLLNSRKLAFLGLLLACTVLLVILSGTLEFNTLFLLAGASFCVGIAIRESGIRFGFGFYLAGVLLSLFLAPNKLYCFTFAAMGFYLVIAEYSFDKLVNVRKIHNRKRLLWAIKFITFNFMYIPMLLLLPELFFRGDIDKKVLLIFILVGQPALFIFDMAYNYFQKYIWGKVRGKLHL